jgi:hypothetical protein
MYMWYMYACMNENMYVHIDVCTGERRDAFRILLWRPEGKRPLDRLRRRWEDNIKSDLQDVGWGGMDWAD